MQRLFVSTIVKVKVTWKDSVLNPNGQRIQIDNGDTVTIGQASQELTTTTIFQTDDLDAFDSDYDEALSASAVLIAKLSAYDSDVLSDVSNLDTNQTNNVIDQKTENEVVQDTTSSAQQDAMIMSITKEMSNQIANVMRKHESLTVTDIEETLKLAEENKKYFEIEKKELFIDNDRLLKHIICQDVICIAMHADLDNKSVVPANDNHLEYA
ncbi:hypothetical protein Tco_0456038 [Tanacetum coccineum]